MLNEFKELPRGYKIAIAAFAAAMLAWVTFINVMDHVHLQEYKAQMEAMPETVTLMTQDGPISVPKDDYEAAQEQWRADHPEEYGIDAEGR